MTQINVGRKVLMIGGPDAGRIRIVPESAGDHLRGDDDWIYKIWTMSFKGNKQPIHFAYDAEAAPGAFLVDMWREYSPAVQIKGDEKYLSYQTLKRNNPEST